MKLLLHLFFCWLGAFALMLITLGILGSILDRKELLEFTGGNGLTVYLFWGACLSAFVCLRKLFPKIFPK